jgi:CBS-domain-containing membrane protein
MSKRTDSGTAARPDLGARTAADLMTPDPVSVSDADTAGEAVAFLTERGFGAAPVIDEAGRPVGVLSGTDLLVHALGQGGAVGGARVRDLMTPSVLCVRPETPAREVAEQLARLKVHQLYVVDQAGVLVGVISTLGLLRHLRP